MISYTVDVPESEAPQFEAFLLGKGYAHAQDEEIPLEVQKLVLDRIKANTDADYIPWDEAMRIIFSKKGRSD